MNKFLYIDDNPPSLNDGIISDLNSGGTITVVPKEAKPWADQIDLLTKEEYDGLLIDWRLGDIVKYDAEALAIQIRILVSNNTLKKDVPVLLCSANKKFEELYSGDQSSHNLFLSVHTKADIANKSPQIVLEMNDLAEAFKIVQLNNFNINNILDSPDNILIDQRIDAQVRDLNTNSTKFNLIHFVLNELIKKTRPLIDEDIMAARLGIDLHKSEDWGRIRDEYLIAFTYRGILHKGWQRWWAEGLEQWWEANISQTDLRGKSAKQRVKLIIEKTGLSNLIHAEKDDLSFGSNFWTVCAATKRPLDPTDGLRIIPPTPLLPWQEEQFISPYGLLEYGPEFLKKNNLRLNPFEKERWEKIRQISKQ